MRYLRIVLSSLVLLWMVMSAAHAASDATTDKKSVALTPDKAADKKQKDIIAMAEQFGLIVGPVTEDVRKELNLRSAEGVAVFEVIGDSLAEAAGIKVGAVIAEINKKPVRNLEDFGRLMAEVLPEGNFTVGTWEPTNPENQGQAGQMNFHFVPKRTD
jgi:S1-C subfamily serine protease